MSEQSQGKILALAALAALIGMDGFFSLIDRKIRDAGYESAIHVQSNPANPSKNIVINISRVVPKAIFVQSELLIDKDPELLNNEEAAPLTDEELELIEWNEDQSDILRNAAIGQKALHQQA